MLLCCVVLKIVVANRLVSCNITLRNHHQDDNNMTSKTNWFYEQKTALHVHHAF